MTTPHLTPEKLFGDTRLPGKWENSKIAVVCFTPFPAGFDPYVVEISSVRYFLHSPQSEVRFCEFNATPFIVISEVYGFAVGTTTVEELAYYGIDHLVGLGYVGAIDGADMG